MGICAPAAAGGCGGRAPAPVNGSAPPPTTPDGGAAGAPAPGCGPPGMYAPVPV